MTQNSGSNNVSGSIPAAIDPLTLVNSGSWGSNWGHAGTGRQFVPTPGTTVTPTFSTGVGANIQIIAAEFTPAVPTQYWDVNDDAPGAGGPEATGTWDDTATLWNPLADGTDPVAAWSPGSTAVFAAGTDADGEYTVTVDGTQVVDGLVFEEGTVTLADGTGGALSLANTGAFSVASGLSATIGIPVDEEDPDTGLLKAGPGTLLLSGDLAFTGLFTNTDGTTILSGDNSAATGGMVLASGITQFESPVSINGSGVNVTLNPNAIMAFGDSFGTETDVQDALERLTGPAGIIAADNFGSKDFDFDDLGLTDAFLGALGTVDYTGTLTPAGSAYRLGGAGGTLKLNQALTSGYSLDVGVGTLQLNGSDATNLLSLPAGAVLQNASDTTPITVTANLATTTLFAGSLEDGGDAALSFVKTGNGALTLAGTNNFSGDIEIGGGTLTLGSAAAWGGSGKDVTFSATGTLQPFDGYTGGILTVNPGASATITPTANGVTTFATTTDSGNLTYGANGNARRLDLGDASSFTGNLQARLLTNANYNTNTTIQFSSLGDGVGSALQFVNATGGNNNSAQALTVLLSGGSAPLVFNNRVIETLPRAAGNWSPRDTILANNNSSAANTWTINTDLVWGYTNNSNPASRNFILSGTNTGDNAFNGVVSDTVAVPLDFQKTGSGKWILGGENTYTGNTTVTAGTLEIGGSGTLGNVSAGVGDYAANISIASTNSGRLVYNSSASQTLGGVISGAGALFVEDGTLTLTNDNTYAGATTVNGGTLALVGGSQDSAITVNDEANLGFALGSPTTSTKAVILNSGHAIAISGTVDNASDYLLMTATSFTGTPTLSAAITDYELELRASDTELWLAYTGTGGGNPFDDWATGGELFNDDASGDGIANGLAFLLGADGPGDSALDLSPTSTEDGGDLVLTFSMRNAAARGDATLSVEYGNDLAGWTTVLIPDVAGETVDGDVTFDITLGDPLNSVTASIASGAANTGKLFARLSGEDGVAD